MYKLRQRYRRKDLREIAHTTTASSRMIPRSQIAYSIEPGTEILYRARPALSVKSAHYRAGGVGGYGADPFRSGGVGGYGADPFRIGGVGGYGADPFAIITEPLWPSAMTVFRLIAPARTGTARRISGSWRDIECLRGSVSGHLYGR